MARLDLLVLPWLVCPSVALAQVNYVARFALEKPSFLLGEPIFCQFTLQNTGTQTLGFPYRVPDRALNPELESEPGFVVTDTSGRKVADPAPGPCGGAKGSVVYGSVMLPPGRTHSERWLLNQWARFSAPGHYRLRAERRLPLLGVNSVSRTLTPKPVAYAVAINELTFEVAPASEPQLRAAFQPYVKIIEDGAADGLGEAALVLTTLPRSFFLEKLVGLATAPPSERRWDRQQALVGLARLGNQAAWEAILRIARGEQALGPLSRPARPSADTALRAYAILLLGQKRDAAFVPPLLELARTAHGELRGSVLRALGFFDDPRAIQALFDRLHSAEANDRVNAILGLRNLESKNVIPSLLAMLNDPDARVRQVAHFALQGLTGQRFRLSARASRSELARIAEQWHTWWREHGANLVLTRQPPCQDW